MSDLVLAIDVGGTKIAAGVVDGDGSLLRGAVRATPADDAEQAWAQVRSAVDEVLAGTPSVRAVGIGCAGPVDTGRGTVSPINIGGWRDFPLRARVADLVPGVPVRLAGDGVCIALGEHWRGAGRSSQHLLGMVVSTGVGGGLVLAGRPFGGRTGNAGHVGHVVVEPDGLPCTCGGRGCVETVASGPHLVRWAREHGWQAPPGADAADLAEAARSGDAVAAAAFERGGRAVGMMIAGVAAVCDLDLVVVGGGVAKAGPLLFDPVRRALDTHAGLGYLSGLRVVPAELGGEAGLIGAAALLRP
ncbi:glucokinase (EC 2.7.1.2) [Streptoalloteichus tenebrarius]|uniref:Glucokinase n=1 Tax=Streptoalloteichus tenebrarius (strain ATCC 17920 / DSM 40477 / JCM 4838 / CBS 697.72 / NBRC 16177 / NCIMB 11028 / NRRL B-12390 / A12253. 1 / ISP 5477) TaxID=1933 RepID=A0ABT1I2D5_STRSD|nr:ROK family protein [Streptoalloteichus tenebrarius]MCP2261924.1 glucokinase (EC 2.7.1.2) [Streptoalloteichus tenebrarius]